MSIRDFEILAAMDAEDEAEARAQADAPPAKRQKGAVFVSRAHPEGRPDTGTYAKPEADDTSVMDEASFRRTVLFAYIAKFTREVAFKEKRRMAERVYIDTATDEQLADRMRTYNKGVDREDFLELYRDKKNWTHFEFHGKPLVDILDLGEVVNPETTQLLGSFCREKVVITTHSGNTQRSHMTLVASGKQPREGETADHINPFFPLNDSISNLRWADGATQRTNRLDYDGVLLFAHTIRLVKEGHEDFFFASKNEAAAHLGVTKAAISNACFRINKVKGWSIDVLSPHCGNILPQHPDYDSLDITDLGEYRTSQIGKGSYWRKNENERARLRIESQNKKFFILRISIECIMGRKLQSEEEGDHVNGDYSDSRLSNAWPVLSRINCIKKYQQFTVGVQNKVAKVFISALDAGRVLNIKQQAISNAVNGRSTRAGGYTWRNASVVELERIFDELAVLETKPWGEVLEMLEDYKDHHYYEVMRAQALLSKEYAEKLAAWRATLGQNAAA